MVPAALTDRLRTESVSEGPLLRDRLVAWVACGLPASSLHADLRVAGGARPASPTIRPEIAGLFRSFSPLTVNQLHKLGNDCMSGALSARDCMSGALSFAPLTVNQLHGLGENCMSGALSSPSILVEVI